MRRAIVYGALGLAVVFAGLRLLSTSGDRDAVPGAVAGGPERPSSASVATGAESAADRRVAPDNEAPASAGPVRAAAAAAADGEDAGNPERAVPRVELLVAAGFTRARAEEILRREAELRQAAAYREYQATGTVRALTGGAQLASDAGLRQDLGDADFERYLAATGRPTRVVVAGVAASSAAANAGLTPGDEILAYGDERVFNLRELNELALRRSAGETVATTVVRDGQTLRLYVTGGPLGLTPPELR